MAATTRRRNSSAKTYDPNVEMYTRRDEQRIYPLDKEKFYLLGPEPYRSPFYRDYGRLIHSPCFRRLQGKCQLFPGNESDFFRNRLTHSLEVAQIAKAIANRLNWILSDRPDDRRGIRQIIDTDLVQFAGLAHDLGHPPFGHQGEAELNRIMEYHGGFEGNAQTLRLLSKIEKKTKEDPVNPNQKKYEYGFSPGGKDHRKGLNLTFRSLASIIKYDEEIPVYRKPARPPLNNARKPDRPIDKGYYFTEREVVNACKAAVGWNNKLDCFKTVEMQIMDIADDIAYSVYDLEDSLKGGFIKSLDLISGHNNIFEKIVKDLDKKFKPRKFSVSELQEKTVNIFNELALEVLIGDVTINDMMDSFNSGDIQMLIASYAYTTSKDQATNGYYRNVFTSFLVGKFVRSVNIELNRKYPAFSKVYIGPFHIEGNGEPEEEIDITIEVLKRFTYTLQIEGHRLKLVESRGRDIVKEIFTKLLDSDGAFLPEDYRYIYERVSQIKNKHTRELQQHRTICDFVSSMTDKYAVEFYGRLKSENPQSIFKSI